MNLGREIVACALRTKSLRPFVEAGMTQEWLSDPEDLTRALIADLDLDAYKTLLRHWDDFGKTPSVDMFSLSHPKEAYRLPDSDYEPAELTAIFREDRQRVLAQVAAGDIADLVGEDDSLGAADLMEKAARKIRDSRATRNVILSWDSPDYDLDARINRRVNQGVLMGIAELDEQFPGFQDGSLITYLGRAKAGKTSFFLLSVLAAWFAGKRVMIVSIEITGEGIGDRLDAFGASVSFMEYTTGKLADDPASIAKLEDFRENAVWDALTIVQPVSMYTVSDLEYDIDRYSPDVVYVDGFYFMIDRNTGKSGGSWDGHDNLAREMKELAMRRDIPVLVSHQVREKQLTGKRGSGIDDGAMMGGTGLIMASDMVLGIDADDKHVHTVSCTRSRTGYLRTIRGTWDWNTCTFTVMEEQPEVDDSKYAYGGTDD